MRDARLNTMVENDRLMMMDKWMDGQWMGNDQMMDEIKNGHTCHRLHPGA